MMLMDRILRADGAAHGALPNNPNSSFRVLAQASWPV
jgi:hypothetical protein